MKQARAGGNRRGFLLVLLLVGVIGAGAIGWATTRGGGGGPVTIPTGATGPVAVQAQGYVLGNPSAPVEIVEFADFECPGCGQFATVTEPDVRQRIVEAGLARYRFYDFPVNASHRNSAGASLAAACAAEQGKFWEMHDRIFAGQNDWNSLATDDPKPVLAGYARAIGLNTGVWEQCYDGRKYVDRIAAHLREAERRKVQSTPTFIVGDQMVAGVQPFDVIKAMVDSARAKVATPPVAPVPQADTAGR